MQSKLKSWLFGPGRSVATGTVDDLRAHIQRLLEAPEGSSLIIALTDKEDTFLQLTASRNEIQIDHPLITPAQLKREDALRKAFTAPAVALRETRGADGSRFLDCGVPRDAERAAAVVKSTVESVFEIDTSTALRFIGEGLPPAP